MNATQTLIAQVNGVTGTMHVIKGEWTYGADNRTLCGRAVRSNALTLDALDEITCKACVKLYAKVMERMEIAESDARLATLDAEYERTQYEPMDTPYVPYVVPVVPEGLGKGARVMSPNGEGVIVDVAPIDGEACVMLDVSDMEGFRNAWFDFSELESIGFDPRAMVHYCARMMAAGELRRPRTVTEETYLNAMSEALETNATMERKTLESVLTAHEAGSFAPQCNPYVGDGVSFLTGTTKNSSDPLTRRVGDVVENISISVGITGSMFFRSHIIREYGTNESFEITSGRVRILNYGTWESTEQNAVDAMGFRETCSQTCMTCKASKIIDGPWNISVVYCEGCTAKGVHLSI